MKILFVIPLTKPDYPNRVAFAHYERMKAALISHEVHFQFAYQGSYNSAWNKDYLKGLSYSKSANGVANVSWELQVSKAIEKGIRAMPDFDKLIIMKAGIVIGQQAVDDIINMKAPMKLVNGYRGREGKYDKAKVSIPVIDRAGLEKRYDGNHYDVTAIMNNRCKKSEAEFIEITHEPGSEEIEHLKEIEDMNVGQFDRRIKFYNVERKKNSTGQLTPELSELGSKWSRVMERRGNQETDANVQHAEYTHRFHVRWDSAIKQDQIISYAGDYYEILSLTELGRKDTLEIWAKQNNNMVKNFTDDSES